MPYSLDILIDAEIGQKCGKTPKELKLAKLSSQELAAEIHKVYELDTADLSEDEKQDLLSALRKEREAFYQASNSTQTTHSTQATIISSETEIEGDIDLRLYQSLIFVGILGIIAFIFLVEKEFLAALLPTSLVILLLLYRQLPIKHLYVEKSGKIFIKQTGNLIPLDLSSFSYLRLYGNGTNRTQIHLPLLFLAQTKKIHPVFSFLKARLFPKSSAQKVIILFSSWKDEKNRNIAPWALADLLTTACQKAGFALQPQGSGFSAVKSNPIQIS